jgi:hypothetical protein
MKIKYSTNNLFNPKILINNYAEINQFKLKITEKDPRI